MVETVPVEEARHYLLFEVENDIKEEQPDFLTNKSKAMKYKDCKIANEYLCKLCIIMKYVYSMKAHYASQFRSLFRKPLIYISNYSSEIGKDFPVVLACWDRMNPEEQLPLKDQEIVVHYITLRRDMVFEAVKNAREIELKRLENPWRKVQRLITRKLFKN